MIADCQQQLEEDRSLLRDQVNQMYEQGNQSCRLYDEFLKRYYADIQKHIESASMKQRIHTTQQSVETPDESIQAQLMMKIEQLEQQNQYLKDQNSDKSRILSDQTKTINERDRELSSLKTEMNECNVELEKLNYACEQQAKDLKEMHLSQGKIMKELEEVTVERNRLQEAIISEKIKMSEQMNELNELHDGLMKQKKVLEEDQERLNQKYREMMMTGKYQALAPQATEAQLARNYQNSDLPQMVVRRLQKFHNVEIYDIAQNLNGSLIATCGGDRVVRIYDPLNLNQVSQMQSNSDEICTNLCFSPTFESLLVGSTDNSAQLYQIQNWKLKAKLVGHVDQVTSVGYLGGEKDSCVTGSKDRQIKLWNVQNGYCVKTVSTGSQVNAIVSQHNAPLIISGHKDGSLRGYSLRSDPKPIFHEKNLFEDSITSITIASDNNSLLCCSKEGYYIKSYDLRMNKVLRTYQDDKYMNSYDHNKICYGPDEKFIIAGNSDGSLISWETDTGRFYKELKKGQHEGVVLCVSYHPVSGQMYSADTRGNLVIWK